MNRLLRRGRHRLLTAAVTSALAVAGAVLALPVLAQADSSANRIVGGQSGRCIDVPNSTQTNGTQTQLYDCNDTAGQSWTYTSSKQLQVYGNKCLDANGKGTTSGTTVIIWDCNGQTNQQWNLNSDGSVTNVKTGLCLDASAYGTANGTLVQLWQCTGASNQKWTRS